MLERLIKGRMNSVVDDYEIEDAEIISEIALNELEYDVAYAMNFGSELEVKAALKRFLNKKKCFKLMEFVDSVNWIALS